MLSFQDAIDQLSDGEVPSILIANGFSQAWDANIFNYSNILDAASFGNRDKEIKELFKLSGTYDFETIMGKLVSAQMVLESYGGDPALIAQISEDQQILKESLVSAIAKTHPSLPSDVTTDQFIAVRKFLSTFKNVFSLNYDLLLYWAINKFNLDPQNYRVDDGFRYPTVWKVTGTNQNLFFIHGGLHIFDEGDRIRKHASTEEGLTIIDQVRSNLDRHKFPLFVSEPTAQKKKARIEHNPYLYKSFTKLGELEGVLFIHGHSLDENDKHIFDKVVSSNVSKVYVSIFGNENSDANKKSKANALAYIQSNTTSVEFYQAETAPVWA
ncbi:DUF4917 family protein [Aeromonas veronii]|uniref:DUF4917 family protein n=1 Tax=Aeromonas veronii TaxID=654 RepID=UPI0033107F8F|nr:DUF4917 family protein [Aeromonas veronii]